MVYWSNSYWTNQLLTNQSCGSKIPLDWGAKVFQPHIVYRDGYPVWPGGRGFLTAWGLQLITKERDSFRPWN
jgi:hypothetical protein